jgi:hypothetical protein
MGEWRNIDMFRHDSPALAPTITAPASIDIDEGSTATVTATVGGPIARPWIELFESTGSQGRYVVIDQLDQPRTTSTISGSSIERSSWTFSIDSTIARHRGAGLHPSVVRSARTTSRSATQISREREPAHYQAPAT